MKLYIYKGFSVKFLSQIKVAPLINEDIKKRKNVLLYDQKLRRKLRMRLSQMFDEECDERWMLYEEYSLIKGDVHEEMIKGGLQVVLYDNNLYPGYYPIEFEMSEKLIKEILSKEADDDTADEISQDCEKFFEIFNSLEVVEEQPFASFYNYETEGTAEEEFKATAFYEEVEISEENVLQPVHIHIPNDIPLFLKELVKIEESLPKAISVSSTKGLLAERNLASLKAYCFYNKIKINRASNPLEVSGVDEQELIRIAKDEIKIPGFKAFRRLRFYKNPDINNEVVEISQAQIIKEIIDQAENAYSENHIFRDIFITASTGAGKSVMFQIPAIYLAQKHKKLTIIIEPIIALMEDQKAQLKERGYTRVETFNSNLISQAEKEIVLERVKNGEIDLLYLSPETLLSYSMETLIGEREIGLIIVDEAHIVTTWGVGFRPDYWYLGGYINKIRNQIKTHWNKNKKVTHFPICAFTATAVNGGKDDSVSETIISLYMENPIKYVGYIKRDDIKFEINVRQTEKLKSQTYEECKATDLINRINQWIAKNQKTIVYFPYATYASDAEKGEKSFAAKAYDKCKVALYTGNNDPETKKKAFEDFKCGKKPVMLATKAFGMGVDINDIKNVYHYAVTGNLCDYVQEIGRVARKDGLTGKAITDYYDNDIGFMERLFGMSQIRQYQIMRVLDGVYCAYKNKKKRNFLITPEAFTYIFTGKETAEDKQINKLKTCLLMLEKDMYDKFNFKVLIARPRSVFTKAYVCIKKEKEKDVLDSKYGRYFKRIAEGRINDEPSPGSKLSDAGDIYSLDLKALWEDYYQNSSFPQFKYRYFNNKEEIMDSISDSIFIRQKVSVEAKEQFELKNIREKILVDFDYITDTIYSTFKNGYFSIGELVDKISQRYGRTKARIIANSIFALVDPKNECVKRREYEGVDEVKYSLSNGAFKELLRKPITKSSLISRFDRCEGKTFSIFMPLQPKGHDSIALKLISLFDYATYEVAGGEQPEIFIRLNDPEKVRRIVDGEIKYQNNYITKAREKHKRDVNVLRKFFTGKMDNDERWKFIEKYFLGHDVLGKENDGELKNDE